MSNEYPIHRDPEPPPPTMEKRLRQRFWRSFTRTSDGCWTWNGPFHEKGYGWLILKIGGRRGKLTRIRAHRFAWTLFFGPIPDGLFVCHHCDNPPCVNPDHLFLGTAKDNARDSIAKGRFRHKRAAA